MKPDLYKKQKDLMLAGVDLLQANAAKAQKATEAEHAKKQRQGADKLADAEAELAAALAEANDLASKRPDEQPFEAEKDFGTTVAAVESKISTRGTFNSAALRSLDVAAGPMDRIAKASEKTAVLTEKLVRHADHGGLAFE